MKQKLKEDTKKHQQLIEKSKQEWFPSKTQIKKQVNEIITTNKNMEELKKKM